MLSCIVIVLYWSKKGVPEILHSNKVGEWLLAQKPEHTEKYKWINPEGQVYVPRLEPTAPIRLADRNHAHYPSRHCTILK